MVEMRVSLLPYLCPNLWLGVGRKKTLKTNKREIPINIKELSVVSEFPDFNH